jgi:hypothetical protein
MLSQESGERRYIATVYQTSPLILVFLLGAGLWRWRVGWGQVRTARRLDPRAVVEGLVICGGESVFGGTTVCLQSGDAAHTLEP